LKHYAFPCPVVAHFLSWGEGNHMWTNVWCLPRLQNTSGTILGQIELILMISHVESEIHLPSSWMLHTLTWNPTKTNSILYLGIICDVRKVLRPSKPMVSCFLAKKSSRFRKQKSDEIRHILGWFLPSLGPCSPRNGLKSSVLVFPPMDQPIRIAPLSDPQIGEMTFLILHGSSLYTTVCLGSSQRVPPVMFPPHKAHLNGGGFCQFEMLLNHPKKHVANVDL